MYGVWSMRYQILDPSHQSQLSKYSVCHKPGYAQELQIPIIYANVRSTVDVTSGILPGRAQRMHI
jgi:hypothetical protein